MNNFQSLIGLRYDTSIFCEMRYQIFFSNTLVFTNYVKILYILPLQHN